MGNFIGFGATKNFFNFDDESEDEEDDEDDELICKLSLFLSAEELEASTRGDCICAEGVRPVSSPPPPEERGVSILFLDLP